MGVTAIERSGQPELSAQKQALTPMKWLNSHRTTCQRPNTISVSVQELAMDSTESELVEQLFDDAEADLVMAQRRA